jgi:hypothetical protein
MSLKLKNLTQFQEKENFEGKKEKTLILNCDNCIDKINVLIPVQDSVLFAIIKEYLMLENYKIKKVQRIVFKDAIFF